ncbi:TetR/AcrR family transcriptional regulator [Chitinophaga nivalis]|uniref:TetR/AcrR family transcriptional regulator n=1 Tax=Chitinophaga nivalis TaxID=2991709 RepID=A0ABT3IMS0_9BACT|nr:TetR/AcrR family transcriptional regulator [Chitinophaga nivalis]MCW3465228.1 TetR/AcrR family transcriptional regulator [Chitinophaga nivalis]MCW3485080.1 TetR/AcrR family transcriptional regulator [Chitinophaga nivalis]
MPRNKAFDIDHKLTVARDLFWKKGYHATSMHDLVDVLELNRSSIYDTYGNKHTLFLTCLTNYARQKTNEYREAGKGAMTAIAALEDIIRNVVKHIQTDDKSCMMIKTTFELAGEDADVRDVIRRHGLELEGIFVALIKAAQVAGDVVQVKDPHVLARFILSSLSGFWQQALVYRSRKQLQESADFLMTVIKG